MAEEGADLARFQAGGALREGALYVPRAADRELYAALSAGELCYVFATTQTGKSSLKLHVAHKLQADGVRCALIDLGGIAGVSEDDREKAEDQFYYGLAWALGREVGGKADADALWDRAAKLTPVQKWSAFLREELLPHVEGRLVVFLDETNVVLGLPFSVDPFFASIREVYDERARDSRFGAVTFCLLGIAFPEALMKDAARSPFRTGRAIAVGDFTREEMEALGPGLAGAGGEVKALLDEVYAWTHGHPYMMQRVCGILAGGGEGEAAERVRRAVDEAFLDASKPRDPNLRFAEVYLDRKGVPAADLVFLYQRVIEGEGIAFDPNSPLEQHLCLSGLVAARMGDDGERRLELRNKVFAEVLGLQWVKERAKEQTYGEQLRRWREAAPEDKEAYLLKGRALEDVLARVKTRGELGREEAAFLRASQEEAARIQEQAAALETERRERAEERARVARRNAGVLGVLVLVLLGVLGVAGWQYRVARSNERIANGRLAKAMAQQPGRERDALMLGIKTLAGGGADPGRASPPVVEGLADAFMNTRLYATLQGHTKSVVSASFSSDGTRVVTASWDNTARLWDAKAGKPLATLQGHTERVLAASFSSDGTRVVTASEDKTARLWDAKEGKLLAIFQGHIASVLAASFSPDGTRVVTASEDTTARLWDAKDGKLLAILQGHTGTVVSASFSPDGTRVVTASGDRTARQWDAKEGKPIATLQGHTGSVLSASFSPDGTRVVTASLDATARLWDAKEGKPLATLQGHTGSVLSASFSPDGTRVVSASGDKTARQWDAKEGKPLATLQGHTAIVLSASFSPDGTRVVTASLDNTARLWDAKEGKVLATLQGHTGSVLSASFSPDGTRVVTASSDKTARLWDAQEGKSLATLQGHADSVLSASFSTDGTRVVTASWDKTARLWDAKEGKPLATLQGHTDSVLSASFSPDGTRVVTVSRDRTARLWDAKEGKALATLQGHASDVWAASFSPDGTRVVTAGQDDTVRLWDAKEGKLLAILQGYAVSERAASFSPDGTRVVTPSVDKTARLWDAKEGKLLASLQGHTAGVRAASFSPDGTRVVTASWDNTARLWDVTTGEPLAVLRGHLGPVTTAAFSPDSRHVVTASDDGTARIWAATPEGFLIQACRYLREWHAEQGVEDIVAAWADKTP